MSGSGSNAVRSNISRLAAITREKTLRLNPPTSETRARRLPSSGMLQAVTMWTFGGSVSSGGSRWKTKPRRDVTTTVKRWHALLRGWRQWQASNASRMKPRRTKLAHLGRPRPVHLGRQHRPHSKRCAARWYQRPQQVQLGRQRQHRRQVQLGLGRHRRHSKSKRCTPKCCQRPRLVQLGRRHRRHINRKCCQRPRLVQLWLKHRRHRCFPR